MSKETYYSVRRVVRQSLQRREGKKTGKMVQNPKRTGFEEARFDSRQRGNFGSLSLKYEPTTRIQSLNRCTGGEPPAKIFAVVLSF
jgi:hypothetical protein